MPSRDQELLDAIDEARIVLRAYRRLLAISVTVWVGCAALLVVAAFGLLPGGLVAMSLAGVLGSLIFLGWWVWWNHSKAPQRAGDCRPTVPGPAARLRVAERAYQAHLMDSPGQP